MMEAKTDREIMIQMNGKMDTFAETMERIADTLDRLENVKFEGHETRITALERFQYKALGAIAFAVTLGIGALVTIVKLYYHK